MLSLQIVGPKSTTQPQAGLDTMARAGPLAKLITEAIINQHLDPNLQLLYNPLNWAFPNGTEFTSNHDWLDPSVDKVLNRRADEFSPRSAFWLLSTAPLKIINIPDIRMADICQPFDMNPPSEALFDPTKVAIVSNGR